MRRLLPFLFLHRCGRASAGPGAQLYIIGELPDVGCVEDDDIARRLKGEFHILIYDPDTMRRVLLILAFVPAVVLAQAKEYYGAIAYSLGTGAHGWANNHPSRAGCRKSGARAIAASSRKDCKVVVWFKNACGALAVGAEGLRVGAGANQQAAADIEAFKTLRQALHGLRRRPARLQRRQELIRGQVAIRFHVRKRIAT